MPESAARALAGKIESALAHLAEACEHAREVMAEANALLRGTVAKAAEDRADTIPFALQESQFAAGTAITPHWNAESRVLSVGGRIVKRFRVPSRNQQAVLSAFEEEGWPHRIDDPLPYRAGLKAKYRLHFTIGRLNRGGAQPVIRFLGDGTGEGICWEYCEAASVSLPQVANAPGEKRRAA